jgi:16S rRNA C967 or C1407 C5-methylase (RsmB/RsmF family)
MAKKKKPVGREAFETYYQQVFPDPQEFAWFLSSLSQPALPVLRFNRSDGPRLQEMWRAAGLTWRVLDWCPFAAAWPPEAEPGTALPGYAEKLFYPMNAASLVPAMALDPQPGESVLDACAAPGGKALFIYDLMQGQGRLVANDLSPARRSTMQRTFAEYGAVGIEIGREPAETIFRRQAEAFDRILLDSPCSSEKHVYASSRHLAEWSASRVRQLQQRQYGLLSGLLLALKPGGRVVYSTCAVNTEENEGLVGKVLANKSSLAELEPWTLPEAPGQAGLPGDYAAEFDLNRVRRILPHRDGLDPMFVAVFRRTAESQAPGKGPDARI